MSTNLSPVGGAAAQFLDNNGNPLSGGKIYTYEAGTTTPEPTYTTVIGNVAHSNPIILDSAGRVPGGQIWVNASQDYKFVLTTSADVTIATYDDLMGISGTGLATNAVNVAYDPAGSGAVQTNVQAKLRETVSVKDFGAVGDGVANDTTAIQAALDSGALAVTVPNGTYNLDSNTLTLVADQQIHFDGGVLTNGTIACDGNFFFGVRGLSDSITLTGTVANEDGVFFDWFACEKSSQSDYNTFINGANPTFGAIPTIAATNRTILTMLVTQGHAIKFGCGIYPFDAAVSITTHFYVKGSSKAKTLLWCPNSHLFSYSSGGAVYPYFRDIRVEANNSVIYTQSWTVNAIHGLVVEDSFFISYNDHTFHNDRSTTGGTGCPIYGSKFLNCAIYAGAAKGCFKEWTSGSNVFDNVCDLFFYFNGQYPNKKGIPKAIFWNSNARKYCNSNITYSGLDYVAYYDRAALFNFAAYDNVFEESTYSFQAIVKIDAAGSNLDLKLGRNFYIGNVSKENGYPYILLSSNTYLNEMTDKVVLYGNTIRNFSDSYVRVVTTLIDSAGTKYRLSYYEPHSSDQTGNSASKLTTPDATNTALAGMGDIWAADSANISYLQVTRSKWSINGNALSGYASGTTANRPTVGLNINYMYFDTTLGKPIWWNGSVWKDATGATV